MQHERVPLILHELQHGRYASGTLLTRSDDRRCLDSDQLIDCERFAVGRIRSIRLDMLDDNTTIVYMAGHWRYNRFFWCLLGYYNKGQFLGNLIRLHAIHLGFYFVFFFSWERVSGSYTIHNITLTKVRKQMVNKIKNISAHLLEQTKAIVNKSDDIFVK